MFLPCFSDPEQWLTGQVGRPHGRPNQGPVDPAVDRRAQPCARLADTRDGRPAGRPDQRAVLSVFGRSTGRSTGSLQRSKNRPLAVDRPVDQPTVLPDVHKAVHVGRPQRSTSPWFGRPCGRPTWPVSHCSRSETEVKNNFKNSFISSKNSQK